MNRIIAIFVVALGFAGEMLAADQTIAEFYAITNISNVKITFAPKGNFSAADTNVWVLSEDAFVKKTLELIQKLPSTGAFYKNWPNQMPLWRVEILADKTCLATLLIWGTRLEAPAGKNGNFYSDTGGKEKEFVEHIQSVARK